MNNKYICSDREVIITDTNGDIRKDLNYDNIGEILAQENIVESIENEIEENNKLLGKLEDPGKNAYKEVILVILAMFFTMFLCYNVATPSTQVVEDSLLDILMKAYNLSSKAVATIFPIPFGLIAAAAAYTIKHNEIKTYNQAKRNLIGSNLFLNKQLEKEKNKLEELNAKKEVVIAKKSENNPITVNDKEKKAKLRLDLANIALVLRDIKKYYRSYSNGNLIETFKENNICGDEDISYLEEFIDENGPKLIKNFKPKNKNR